MSPNEFMVLVGEFEGRHNARGLDTADQMAAMVRGAEGQRLRYADLIDHGAGKLPRSEETGKRATMRRDMKLIRWILQFLADRDDPWIDWSEIAPAGRDKMKADEKILDYHVSLCVQAGFLEIGRGDDASSLLPTYQLTWGGHEKLAKWSDPPSAR